jgi:sigma-54 dependent transcriptional regulator, acetoin dehydrogenase operon transcriptional activator AcoR
LRGQALKEHVERTELVRHLAAADLERAASDVSPQQFVLLLADAAGVVVSTSGGGRFSDEARRVRLIPGASWGEAARGTNAIGTAIAEKRPVYVRGRAHLGRRFHDLVCYAAPIFDADGTLVAVLDATSTLAHADDSIGLAVVRTADTSTNRFETAPSVKWAQRCDKRSCGRSSGCRASPCWSSHRGV